MEITNPNYNTMPEQVNQNTKDIAVLKNTVKTPAIIYNATVEMPQDAGVINQSNIMQQVTNTANAFVLDTVGKLFRIVTVENDQVYVEYCATITGPRGTPGADGVGIQSITSIAPTQDDGYTVTPVTFTDTNGNQVTLNIRAKNGANAQVDSELSNTSENPVQNKVVTRAVNATNYTELTANSTYVNDNPYQKSYYYKIGNIAIVHINNVVFKAVEQSNNAVLFTNLPRPKTVAGYNDYVFMLSSTQKQSRVYIQANTTELKNYYDSYTPNTSTPFSAVLIYPTID